MGSDTAMDDTVLGLSRVEVQREGGSPSSDIGELLVIKAEWLDASTEIHVHYAVTVITEICFKALLKSKIQFIPTSTCAKNKIFHFNFI